jgi:uncharacterized protein YceK
MRRYIINLGLIVLISVMSSGCMAAVQARPAWGPKPYHTGVYRATRVNLTTHTPVEYYRQAHGPVNKTVWVAYWPFDFVFSLISDTIAIPWDLGLVGEGDEEAAEK